MNPLSRKFSTLKYLPRYRDKRGIVFIDAKFGNCKTLVQQIDNQLRVIVLSSHRNVLAEIAEVLAFSSCEEIYLIARGFPGCLYLGGTELSLNTLLNHSSELALWFNNSTDATEGERRLYLYGNDVAAGDVGAEFIAKLGSILGATIIASARVSQELLSK
ncbi:MAG: DUF4347 domain-containing protein [Cyanobacteria bacterium J06621_8]